MRRKALCFGRRGIRHSHISWRPAFTSVYQPELTALERREMEDRRVPVVLLASDLYNHHAKALMSKSTALTCTLYVYYTCADLKEDNFNGSLDHYDLLSEKCLKQILLSIQSEESN